MKILASFHNLHQGQSLVVCGCGESLNDLESPERFITIGVNDVGRRFQPNYLVVVNPRNQFSGDRFQFVESSQAEYLFTQLDLGIRHPNIVKFRLGAFGGTDFSDKNVLHYTNNSPYIGLCLAILMGAKRIGLIGVDFTDHHFFAETGRHPLAPQFDSINEQYQKLADAAQSAGVEIFNLSAISRLTAFPKISINEFENLSNPQTVNKAESLKIVSYSTMPVAGVPAILARCINDRTEHTARCVWATNDYGNGVKFTGDVEWNEKPREAEKLVAEADLVIVHNGKTAPQHTKYFKDKAVITMAHNYLWNVDEQFLKQDFPGVVVGQYQAVLPEFKNWLVVPNPLPFWEAEYDAKEKNEQITICYTPSGKHEKYPLDHKLYWHSKGFETTVGILEKLSKKFPVTLEIIKNKQISHAASLAMKCRSHIVIDECVTGSYHRNSLEGLACGAVVINGIGILPEVENILQFCTGETAENPFVPATLENLEYVLTELVESGRENLIEKGKANRQWIEKNWNFENQWEKCWIPAIEKSFDKVARKFFCKGSEKNMFDSNEVLTGELDNEKKNRFKRGVSIVIPHGGKNRLPHLRTCLANLRQCEEVGEIIVVEMDETAFAEKIVRRWTDKYIFLHLDGQFERARALNIGSAFAECEYVLWLDNDMIVTKDFISQALAEITGQNLDFLKPYSEVKYLSLADSEKVMQGVLSPDECCAANVYYSTTTDGGAGIVRKSFLEKHGAIPEGFRGWGGEDNGWMHKVSLFGKAGRTCHIRKVTHLYHALSGGYGGSAHYKANPYYQANLELLKQIKNIRDAKTFSENFPPQKPKLWDQARKIIFVSDEKDEKFSASNTAHFLNELFDANFEIKTPNQLNDSENQLPDAIVFFDSQTAEAFLNKKSFAQYAEKTVVIADERVSDSLIGFFQKCFTVLTTDENAAEKFNHSKIKYWSWKNDESREINHESFALAIAQILSFLINTSEKATTQKTMLAEVKSETSNLPFWLYWEGDCPEWIKACQKTILEHAPNARFLTPETFDELRDCDRDINLKNLHVAHRADFIRAFLLYRYGGMWIDSDCVVLKSLSPLFEKLNGHDFAAHRERGGYFGNEFLIAKPESRIAQNFYERICKTLRSKRRFGWCDLGCVPLTDVINKSDGGFMEIECELIQPICWSEVAPYFETRSDGEHQNILDTNAFCYMLSNLTVNKFLAANPKKNLLDDRTFFNFLVRQSLEQNMQNGFSVSKNDSSENNLKNGNGKNSQQTNGNHCRQEIEFYLDIFEKIAPVKVLDADVGLGKWAVLLREMFNERKISIEAIAKSKNESKIFYDRIHVGDLENCLQKVTEKKGLVILGNQLSGDSKNKRHKVLEKSLNISDYVLLNVERENYENYSSFLSEANPGRITDYRTQKNSVMFLLSQNDPKNLRRKNKMTDIFTESAKVCSQFEESLSGPGSSLKQTEEIRRRLPILFASMEISSMLDAPCGDFNWLRHIDLRLEKYIGIDIVPSIIEQNRQHFENRNRKFLVSDMTNDFLPNCTLVFCRDCLVHFSFEEIWTTLRNFYNSGAKYLLTTTFPNRQSNYDIQTGDWRPLNFQVAPFNFPAPLRLINEHCTEGNGNFADKSLGLWKISDIVK